MVLSALGVLIAAIVAGSLLISGWLSTPRISSVTHSENSVRVEMSGSGWSADRESVSVSPGVVVTKVDASPTGAVLHLSAPLRSASTYTVRVGGAESSFTTEPQSIIYLDKDGDTVREKDIGGSPRTLFSSPGVEEVREVTGGVVVSYRATTGGTLRVSFVSGDGERVLDESLNGVSNLRSNGADEIGFTTKTAVVTMRTDGSERQEHPVSTSWAFVPGTSQIVSVRDGLLYLSGQDVPLGGAHSLSGVTETGMAVVERGERYRLVDLTGARPDTEIAPVEGGHLDSVEAFPGGTVQVYDERSGEDVTQMRAYVVTSGGSRAVALTERPGAIVQACTSPSGQYVAVSGTPKVSASYLESSTDSRPSGLATVIYDADTGARIEVINGSTPSWCAGSPMWWQHPAAHHH